LNRRWRSSVSAGCPCFCDNRIHGSLTIVFWLHVGHAPFFFVIASSVLFTCLWNYPALLPEQTIAIANRSENEVMASFCGLLYEQPKRNNGEACYLFSVKVAKNPAYKS
jgi:hypothetical protein